MLRQLRQDILGGHSVDHNTVSFVESAQFEPFEPRLALLTTARAFVLYFTHFPFRGRRFVLYFTHFCPCSHLDSCPLGAGVALCCAMVLTAEQLAGLSAGLCEGLPLKERDVIGGMGRAFHRRLKRCVAAGGGHFEGE